MSTIETWVAECVALCQPESVRWCDGSDDEYCDLVRVMINTGTLIPLNVGEYPNCYLHRSHANDVARVESRTFICTKTQEEAGPSNNWMAITEAKEKLTTLFRGCMKGRTMYVVPYLMGPAGSPQSRVGVEITDSPYVVASMRIMTRMGQVALDHQKQFGGAFVPGLHSVGELDPKRRYICHFPAERLIWSYGSGYGGNALLGKKCFALRIASAIARDEGWLAEHMLILEVITPEGEKLYFAGAFPSACGKTNLAMLMVPPTLAAQGWQVRTIGDDIAWIHVDKSGQLRAINPEAGFFGVVPGTNTATNSTAMATMNQDTIFTNVALADDGIPWWEGKGNPSTLMLTDWLGNRRRLGDGGDPLAHPNSRFTAPARNCPTMSSEWESPEGVPLSGILFGGRRADTVPLIRQARDWQQGVFFGATMASQKTAAAEGKVGELRFDPMAMLPFCGYHMGDYFAHWLRVGQAAKNPPAIFAVNWFQKDADNNFLWPGYGENVRALIWATERIRGTGKATETPIGFVPTADALHTEGLALPPGALDQLLAISPDKWRAEATAIEAHFATFGDRLPDALQEELARLKAGLR